MASPYVITITNGSGSKAILNGTYAVTSAVTGYDNTSVLPATQVVSSGVNAYAFTIAATGTLTLHVTEDGSPGGTPVAGAVFARCDSAGNVYGTPITTDVNGAADFPYVPFAASGAPLIYYKQTASDGDHEFDPALTSTTMTTATKTVQVANTPAVTRTITLTDPNYTGLPIASGTLTLT